MRVSGAWTDELSPPGRSGVEVVGQGLVEVEVRDGVRLGGVGPLPRAALARTVSAMRFPLPGSERPHA
jgi:hypothetical protein